MVSTYSYRVEMWIGEQPAELDAYDLDLRLARALKHSDFSTNIVTVIETVSDEEFNSEEDCN